MTSPKPCRLVTPLGELDGGPGDRGVAQDLVLLDPGLQPDLAAADGVERQPPPQLLLGPAPRVAAPSTVAMRTVQPRKNASSAKTRTGLAIVSPLAAAIAGAGLQQQAAPGHRPNFSKAKVAGSTGTPAAASFSRNLGRSPVDLRVPRVRPCVVEAQRVVEDEDVLQGDDVALHADDLGDVGDPARAVLEARLVHDQVDRGGDLLADRADRQVHAGHQHHGLEAGERVARAVGVHRADRAVVAGVHRLQHVERRGVADLADDDAVGAHAQRVADQVADRDLALALDVRRARLEPDHVVLVQLELGGVLDGDDALVARG